MRKVIMVGIFYGVLMAQQDKWRMFRHDLLHTGFSTLKGEINSPYIIWTYQTNGIVSSSPAVADINKKIFEKLNYNSL